MVCIQYLLMWSDAQSAMGKHKEITEDVILGRHKGMSEIHEE